MLALLDGAAVSAAGYTLAASGPASVMIGATGITAEANLSAGGELRLTLPQANPALQAVLIRDGQEIALPVQPGTVPPSNSHCPRAKTDWRCDGNGLHREPKPINPEKYLHDE